MDGVKRTSTLHRVGPKGGYVLFPPLDRLAAWKAHLAAPPWKMPVVEADEGPIPTGTRTQPSLLYRSVIYSTW